MFRPPLSEGVAQVRVALLAARLELARFLGADATVARVVAVMTLETGPVPISLMAETRNW